MLASLLRYGWYWARYPHWRDYLSMGMGIEARYLRCRDFWKGHLQLCKQFQSDALAELGAGAQLAVLGAGRLYDLPVEQLLAKGVELSLYDADPLAVNSWRSWQGKQLRGYCVDLTGVVHRWSGALESLLRSKANNLVALADLLQTLAQEDLSSSFSLPHQQRYDAMVSLNLLSQLPIYWRDRVHAMVKRQWGIDTDDNGSYPRPLQEALELSYAAMQRQHLELLRRSGAARVVLIADEEIYYYQPYISPFQVERSLWVAHPLQLPGYRVCRTDSWWWHIAPCGVEQQGFGVIHKVAAVAWERVDVAQSPLISSSV